MTEDNWQQARLIPTSGISGRDEAERRATSALLAVMGSVREFGTAVVRGLGAPGGQLGTFIEVPFKADERTIYPDGVLQTSRGGRTWTCLVEVKTGASELERPQVEAYLDVARENGFDGANRSSCSHRETTSANPLSLARRVPAAIASRTGTQAAPMSNGPDECPHDSNQIAPAPEVHPVDVDRRKVKKVALHHPSRSGQPPPNRRCDLPPKLSPCCRGDC